MKVFYAWAIDTHSDEGHVLIGRYWWFNGSPIISPQNEGCRIVVFKTRKIARENLQSVKSVFKKAKVVKVSINIKEV